MKTGIIILLSILFGFALSSMLSIPAGQLHLKSVKIALILEHEKMGINSLRSGAINEASFHFRNAIYLIKDENIQDLFDTISKEWGFLNPVKAIGIIIGIYVFEFDLFDMQQLPGKTVAGSVMALHAYTLEKSGDFKAAQHSYKEAADLLEFAEGDIDKVKKLAQIQLLDNSNKKSILTSDSQN